MDVEWMSLEEVDVAAHVVPLVMRQGTRHDDEGLRIDALLDCHVTDEIALVDLLCFVKDYSL